jgi:hypothetical protein
MPGRRGIDDGWWWQDCASLNAASSATAVPRVPNTTCLGDVVGVGCTV